MLVEMLLEACRSDVFFAFAVFQTSDRSEMMQICENTHKCMTTEIFYIKTKVQMREKYDMKDPHWLKYNKTDDIEIIQCVEITGDSVKCTK